MSKKISQLKLMFSNDQIRLSGIVVLCEWGSFSFEWEGRFISQIQNTFETLKTLLNNIFKLRSRWNKISKYSDFLMKQCLNSQYLFNLKFEIFDFKKCFVTNNYTNKSRIQLLVLFLSLGLPWFWSLSSELYVPPVMMRWLVKAKCPRIDICTR